MDMRTSKSFVCIVNIRVVKNFPLLACGSQGISSLQYMAVAVIKHPNEQYTCYDKTGARNLAAIIVKMMKMNAIKKQLRGCSCS